MLQQRLLAIEVGLGFNNFAIEKRDPKLPENVYSEDVDTVEDGLAIPEMGQQQSLQF